MAYGLRHAAHLKIVGELLYMNYEKFVNDLHDWRKLGDDAWDSHFFSLLGQHRLRESDDEVGNNIVIPPALKNWAPVSRFSASNRGRGSPIRTGIGTVIKSALPAPLSYQKPSTWRRRSRCQVGHLITRKR